MTATERLRELLDERGVEWAAPDESWNQDSITYWKVGSIKWVAFESENGTLWLNCNSVTDLTPSQAIAATLGAGTCHDKGNIERFICSECGCRLDLQDDDWEANMWLDNGVPMVPRFCPNCGVKVVDE